MPSEFVTEKNDPLDIEVIFSFGMAEVPSNVGKYMLDHGLASKTQLIIPDGVKAA